MPGMDFRSWKTSRVTALLNSAVEPLRITRICSGLPEDWNAVCRPFTSARTASSTATVSAIPSAVMRVVVFRTTRLRRL